MRGLRLRGEMGARLAGWRWTRWAALARPYRARVGLGSLGCGGRLCQPRRAGDVKANATACRPPGRRLRLDIPGPTWFPPGDDATEGTQTAVTRKRTGTRLLKVGNGADRSGSLGQRLCPPRFSR